MQIVRGLTEWDSKVEMVKITEGMSWSVMLTLGSS